MDYLMPKLSLQKNSSNTIQPIAERVHTLPTIIKSKVKVTAPLDFERVFFGALTITPRGPPISAEG